MTNLSHALTTDEVRVVYDKLGRREDRQSYYKDFAIQELISHAAFEQSKRVVEFGCGTGRFAAGILKDHLPAEAEYLAIDTSNTMVRLTEEKLQPWGSRISVQQSHGEPEIDLPSESCDHFVSNYVLNVLPLESRVKLLSEARRILQPDGRLCLIVLGPGDTLMSRAISTLFRCAFLYRPALVGNCEPLKVRDYLASDEWLIEYFIRVTRYGMNSEIAVATPM